ncbi:unnamed protein product [Brassica rapa]|uniref:DC1 domain-containing protein n=1 Tax=Brassica campestris TaxID=3711 RepID=A0A3P5ZTL2_BRACM|nr:unnamed protein product [Brassica rapa]VDC78013.1 unnamed protein product [Brassica rapa]
MDTTISPMYKLSIHEHPLLPSAMFIDGKCDGCRVRGLMYAYSSKWFFTCFDCGVTLHDECVLGDFSRLTPKSKLFHSLSGKRIFSDS